MHSLWREERLRYSQAGSQHRSGTLEDAFHLILRQEILALCESRQIELEPLTALPKVPTHVKNFRPAMIRGTEISSGRKKDRVDFASPPPEPPPKFDPRENPDGGATAWLTVFGAFLTLFCSFGWVNTMGVWQDYYQNHQLSASSPSAISWITSIGTFLMFFLGPVAGIFLDRFGPQPLLLTGSILHVLGLMMTSLSTTYYQFILSQAICSPLGICLLFYSAVGSVPTWFWSRKALAMGIVVSGSSMGGTILPIMTQRLIADVGFAWSLRITAFLILHLLTIALFTVKSRMKPQKHKVRLFDMVRPLSEVSFILASAGAFFFALGFFIPLNFIVVEALAKGVSPKTAEYLVSILNAASLPGRILPGYCADRIGPFNVMIITCFCTVLLIAALWLPAASTASIVAFAILYGFFSGAFVSMCNSVIAAITPDMRTLGRRTGTFYAIFAFAPLFASPVGGALVDRWQGRYAGLQIFASAMALTGACTITAGRLLISGASIWRKL